MVLHHRTRMAIIEWLGGVDKRILCDRRSNRNYPQSSGKISYFTCAAGMKLRFYSERTLIASGGAKWLQRCMRRAPIEFFRPRYARACAHRHLSGGSGKKLDLPRAIISYYSPFSDRESRCEQARICIF